MKEKLWGFEREDFLERRKCGRKPLEKKQRRRCCPADPH